MKFTRKDYNGRIIDTANKIPEDEVCFLLRGQDKLAPMVILKWAMEFRLAGGDPQLARDAEDAAQAILDWQKANPDKVKLPDSQKSIATKFIRDELKSILTRIEMGEKIPVSIVEDWVRKLYGTIDGYLHILLPSDLNPNYSLGTNKPKFEDFILSPEETSSLFNAKIVLFYTTLRGFVLKADL